MIRVVSGVLVAVCLVVLLRHTAGATADTPEEERRKTRLAVEALSRLQGVDLEANPGMKAAVMKVVNATRGTPDFVRLVQQFKIRGQAGGLMEMALKDPAGEAGVAAAKMIFAEGEGALFREQLRGTNAPAAAEALGNTHEKAAVPFLVEAVSDVRRPDATRKAGATALAQTPDGAWALVKLLREGKLDAELKRSAGLDLSKVRWPEIKAAVAQLAGATPSTNKPPFPAVSEMAKQTGDPSKGERLFGRQDVGCINCHRVNGMGVELGPDLSGIGAKLPKEALYEAILDPSAGISFGFEAWQIELKSGDEAYGIIVSESTDELVVKDARGVPMRLKKSEAVNRQPLKTSIMPTGLQENLTAQEMVDLVEYLTTLRVTVK